MPEEWMAWLKAAQEALRQGASREEVGAALLEVSNGRFASTREIARAISSQGIDERLAEYGRQGGSNATAEAWKDFGRAFRHGLSFGSEDELAGLAAALIPGGEGYDEARDRWRDMYNLRREVAPGATMAGEMAGAMVVPSSAGLMGAKALPETATLAQRAAQGARVFGNVGAIEGGLYGFMEGEDPAERIVGMGFGIPTGFIGGTVAGAALPYAGAGARRAYRWLQELGEEGFADFSKAMGKFLRAPDDYMAAIEVDGKVFQGRDHPEARAKAWRARAIPDQWISEFSKEHKIREGFVEPGKGFVTRMQSMERYGIRTSEDLANMRVLKTQINAAAEGGPNSQAARNLQERHGITIRDDGALMIGDNVFAPTGNRTIYEQAPVEKPGRRPRPEVKQQSDPLFQRAVEMFGVTDDINQAGYILPDGTMLDFGRTSRQMYGAEKGATAADTYLDHKALADAGAPVRDFLDKGVVRVSARQAGMGRVALNVEAGANPLTEAQRRALIDATPQTALTENGTVVRIERRNPRGGYQTEEYFPRNRGELRRNLESFDAVPGQLKPGLPEGVEESLPENIRAVREGRMTREEAGRATQEEGRRAVEASAPSRVAPEEEPRPEWFPEDRADPESQVIPNRYRRGARIEDPLEMTSLGEARDFAMAGSHLIRDDETGGFVGAPEWVKTRADLIRMRQMMDEAAERGRSGMTWYDRQRQGIAEIAGPDETAQEILAAKRGITSSQAQPRDEALYETRMSVGQAGGKSGEDIPAGRFGFQQRGFQDLADLGLLPGRGLPWQERVKLMIDQISGLGQKTAVYGGVASNPTESRYTLAPHDMWDRWIMGYADVDKMTPAQRRFADFEQLLWANRMGMTGQEVQAAGWTTVKAEGLMEKFGISWEDALTEARKTALETLSEFTGLEPYELMPAAQSGHLPELIADAEAQRRWEGLGSPWVDESGRDILYGALPFMGQRPTQEAQGMFVNNAGELELNPSFVARPVVAPQVTGDLGMTPESQAVMKTAQTARGLIDVQARSAGSLPMQRPGMKPLDAHNGLLIPFEGRLTEEQMKGLSKVFDRRGMYAAPVEGGIFAGPAGPGAPTGSQLRAELAPNQLISLEQEIRDVLGDVGPIEQYMLPGEHVALPWEGPQGTGSVSRAALQSFDEAAENAPLAAETMFDDPRVRGVIAEMDRRARSGQYGTPREDVLNLYQVLMQGGLPGLRAAVEAGKIALPAAAAVSAPSLFDLWQPSQ